eukprot:4854714-Pyramimonas_sp.AAC.1
MTGQGTARVHMTTGDNQPGEAASGVVRRAIDSAPAEGAYTRTSRRDPGGRMDESAQSERCV